MEKMELLKTFIQILLFGLISAVKLKDLGVIQTDADNLDKLLESTLDTVSLRANLTQIYKEQTTKYGEIKKVDGPSLVKQLAENLQKILDAKVKALKKAVEFAEKVAENYTWDAKLELDEVKERFVDGKLINESAPEYQYDEKFKQKVSFDNSSVHIPVEIFKGEIGIMNGLMWTDRLDEIWKKNKDEDPDLLWQYFGSQTGIMRNFPASKWRGETPDLYDVRRRPWYTQGASSPKDMFILIDTSGSTHGQALALMKQSVISILDTLGENDFVNVGHFADKAGLVACFDTFVQANHWNKQVLIKKVQGLVAKNMAKYDIGFEFAFQQFEKYYNESSEDDNGQSARCNRIIMFLTDGGTDMPEAIFRKYNWDRGNKTRIFSYAVGPTANPVAAARWIACANRGYFYKIPAMGAIRSAVQDYVSVIARPMAAYQPRSQRISSIYADRISDYTRIISSPMSWAPGNMKHWSDIYIDSFGLGMMTTVTMPVYNTVNWTADQSNQTILGVMGSDVTVNELENHIPQKQLGPNGYAFALNSNGYIVFHPNLKAVRGYLKDPPNVDFLDVEYASVNETEKEELRKRMIDQETSTMSINTLVVVSDEKHIDIKYRNYHFTGIADSTFSVGVVLPNYKTHYCDLSKAGIDTKTGVDSLKGDISAIFLAPWDYCSNVSKPENVTQQTTLDELLSSMLNDTQNCNPALLQHLFFDGVVTKLMEPKWANSLKSGFETVFVATDSGLTRVFTPNVNDSVERFDSIKDVWSEVYYKRSMENSDQWMFMAANDAISNASAIINENTTAPLITATKAIGLSTHKPAVIGVQMTQSHLRDLIKNSADDCTKDGVICYLLDDAGLLVTSTDDSLEHKIGTPFEDIEPSLMSKLLTKKFLVEHKHHDYQGVCKPEKETNSAGFRSVVPPMIFELLSVKWWTTRVAWAYLNFNVYSWMSSMFGGHGNQVSASDEEYSQRNFSCIKKGAQYYKGDPPQKTFKDWAKCGNCSRSMFSAQLQRTNLVLVVAFGQCKESSCDVTSDANKFIREYEKDEDPNFSSKPDSDDLEDQNCNVTRRYRKRPQGCYDFNSHEENHCGRGSVIKVDIYTIVITTILTIVMSSVTSSVR